MSDDDERFFNMVVMGAWVTNKEMEEMAPFLGIALVVVLVAVCIFFACKGCGGQDEQKAPEKPPAGQVVLIVGEENDNVPL